MHSASSNYNQLPVVNLHWKTLRLFSPHACPCMQLVRVMSNATSKFHHVPRSANDPVVGFTILSSYAKVLLYTTSS